MNTLSIRSTGRIQMIDITGSLQSLVREQGIREGICTVFVPHTTAAVTINENADPSVVHDMLMVFDQVIPRSHPGYRHDEGNSDAHCKSSLVGCSEQVLIHNGSLTLGTWQGIYFCEFDGPRHRKVIVQVRGE